MYLDKQQKELLKPLQTIVNHQKAARIWQTLLHNVKCTLPECHKGKRVVLYGLVLISSLPQVMLVKNPAAVCHYFSFRHTVTFPPLRNINLYFLVNTCVNDLPNVTA